MRRCTKADGKHFASGISTEWKTALIRTVFQFWFHEDFDESPSKNWKEFWIVDDLDAND